MKRFLCLTLAVVLLLTVTPVGVSAAQPKAVRKSGVYQYLVNEIKTQGQPAFGGYVYQ